MCKQGHTLISPGASRAITPNPSGHIMNEDEPLDWGSDDEKYASFLSSYTHFAYSMTASHHPLKGLKDGSFKHVVSGEVNKLYNVQFDVLDILKCEHDFILNQCAKCCEKTSTMWLLDSGASGHFSNNRSDFIHYTPLSKINRIPVQTASTPTFVEGYGTVLLKHKLNGSLVTT